MIVSLENRFQARRVTVNGVDVTWRCIRADEETGEAHVYRVIWASEQGSAVEYGSEGLKRFERLRAVNCPWPAQDDGSEPYFAIDDGGMIVDRITGKVVIEKCA